MARDEQNQQLDELEKALVSLITVMKEQDQTPRIEDGTSCLYRDSVLHIRIRKLCQNVLDAAEVHTFGGCALCQS